MHLHSRRKSCIVVNEKTTTHKYCDYNGCFYWIEEPSAKQAPHIITCSSAVHGVNQPGKDGKHFEKTAKGASKCSDSRDN